MSFLNPIGTVIDLAVNIDHVATVRNAGATVNPDPVAAALLACEAGADVITLQWREGRRHIREAEVLALRQQLSTRLNLEIAMSTEMLAFACQLKPHNVCLVPERPTDVKVACGLDVIGKFEQVKAAVAQLQNAGIRVALFIDPDEEQIKASVAVGAPIVELNTGCYAGSVGDAQHQQLLRIQNAARFGVQNGLKINAGHGLHYENVQAIAALTDIAELNIGHAIVAHAVFVGWQNAVREMKALMHVSRVAAWS